MQPGYWLYDYLISDGHHIKPFYMRKSDTEKISFFKKQWRRYKAVFSILFNARNNDLILVYDCDTEGIYIGLFISFFRPSLMVYKINCMAASKGNLYSPFKRLLVRQAYTHIITSVNNEKIAQLFSEFLNLPISHFIPIPDSISDFGKEILSMEPEEEIYDVFMGGNTHRDYTLFVEAAKRLPQYRFHAVTTRLHESIFNNKTANLSVEYSLPEREFYKRIAQSKIVFVPLTTDVQGGQMVLFQGALLKKALVSTRSETINTYFDARAIILLEIGDVERSVLEIMNLMDDAEKRKDLGEQSYLQISRFTTSSIYNEYKTKLFR